MKTVVVRSLGASRHLTMAPKSNRTWPFIQIKVSFGASLEDEVLAGLEVRDWARSLISIVESLESGVERLKCTPGQ